MNITQLRERKERLQVEYTQVDNELQQARADLQAAAIQDIHRADAIAARVMVLETRKASLEKNIQEVEGKYKTANDFMKSKEYKDGLKSIEKMEEFFSNEAAAMRDELNKLSRRLQDTLGRRAVLQDLVNRYCADMETVSRNNKARGGDSVAYLNAVFEAIHSQEKRQAMFQGFKKASRSV